MALRTRTSTRPKRPSAAVARTRREWTTAPAKAHRAAAAVAVTAIVIVTALVAPVPGNVSLRKVALSVRIARSRVETLYFKIKLSLRR